MFSSVVKQDIQEITNHMLKSKKVRLLIQREDLNNPHCMGNKWWKLRYNLTEAIRQNQRTILTFGGAFSNHIAATASACNRLSLKSIGGNLYTKNLPDPDILIRTGGHKRLSNFMLWQLAYTEIYFIEKLWPDFNGRELAKIIDKFKKTKRNFGAI